jgi:hypothetical protein
MRRFVRENGLSLFFFAIFAMTLVGQSLAGRNKYNAVQAEHGGAPVSWWSYITSTDFGGSVMENWQSEFLQFSLFILATIWLVQKGSNESKVLEDAGLESKVQQRIGRNAPANAPRWAKLDDWRTRIYENSLLLAMTAVFFATWLAQSLNNLREFNDDARQHGGQPIGWTSYLGTADFWERTLQNWQSEFLAVGTMVVFTIYLRQRGSPESKPVGAPHHETASSG